MFENKAIAIVIAIALFIRIIRKIRVRFKKVLYVLGVLFYTKNLHKGAWHLRVNQ